MDDKLTRRKICAAVQQHCAASGVQPDPYLARRVLAAAQHRDERRPGRRLSAGMLLALVLALLAVTAVAAALLSVREIVDEHAVPMAQQSIGETDYTSEEVRALVQLARENGIVLSDQALANIDWALDQEEGYAKDELVRQLAYAEFGSDMSAWTLEQQRWFDDALVAMGVLPEPQKAMPEQPDDARALAVSRAVAYLTGRYAVAGDLTDETQYRTGAQYLNGDADGDYPGLYWSIDFQPRTITGGEYWVYLRDDGEILGEWVRPGLSADSTPGDVEDAYRSVFGTSILWDQPIRQSFLATVKQLTPSNNKAYLCLIRTEYPDVPENALSMEEAYAVAAADLGVTQYRVLPVPLITTDTNPVWKLRMSSGDQNYSFEIDCITGEIRTKRLLDKLHLKWWMGIVLWEVSDEVDATWVDDRPSVG